MNTQIFYLDNGFLIQIWKQVLKKTDDVIINKIYNNSVIEMIILRSSSHSEKDMPFMSINNNLEISYGSDVTKQEKIEIYKFLTGNGFTIKS